MSSLNLFQTRTLRGVLLCLAGTFALAGCTSAPVTAQCDGALGTSVEGAAREASSRIGAGCAYHFDDYFAEMLALAEANPDAANRVLFSDFLVAEQARGTLSERRAKGLYNRYFGVKFVSLQGDYNTCAQTCPVRATVLSDMRTELQHKERGMLRASEDTDGFYRADALFKEAELVLEATCRACEAGGI